MRERGRGRVGRSTERAGFVLEFAPMNRSCLCVCVALFVCLSVCLCFCVRTRVHLHVYPCVCASDSAQLASRASGVPQPLFGTCCRQESSDQQWEPAQLRCDMSYGSQTEGGAAVGRLLQDRLGPGVFRTPSGQHCRGCAVVANTACASRAAAQRTNKEPSICGRALFARSQFDVCLRLCPPPPPPLLPSPRRISVFRPVLRTCVCAFRQVRFIIAPGKSGSDQTIENLREQLLLQVTPALFLTRHQYRPARCFHCLRIWVLILDHVGSLGFLRRFK